MSKYYFTNDTPAGNDPSTWGWYGGWDGGTTSAVTKRLGENIGAGNFTSVTIAEGTSTVNTTDIALGRWVSDPLSDAVSFASGDTWQAIFGVLESNIAADFVSHVHIWISNGDADSVKSTLVNNVIAADAGKEWETTAGGTGNLFNGSTTNALADGLSAAAADRIIVDVGYQAQNTVSVSYDGTMYYGGASGADLQNYNGGCT